MINKRNHFKIQTTLFFQISQQKFNSVNIVLKKLLRYLKNILIEKTNYAILFTEKNSKNPLKIVLLALIIEISALIEIGQVLKTLCITKSIQARQNLCKPLLCSEKKNCESYNSF